VYLLVLIELVIQFAMRGMNYIKLIMVLYFGVAEGYAV